MEWSGLNSNEVCTYCRVYQKIHSDYPSNPATYDTSGMIPRCSLHAQYTCDSCGEEKHFNGVGWCSKCRTFTCIQCGGDQVREHHFLVYSYYYSPNCTNCATPLVTLDYAEAELTHPYQIGDLRPDVAISVWVPMSKDIKYLPQLKEWGREKLLKLSVDGDHIPAEYNEEPTMEKWDQNAEVWNDLVQQGDVNHQWIIIPQMIDFLNPKMEKIMDIACGEGSFTRKLAEEGYQVVATEISKLIEYAVEMEQQHPLGIEYHRIGVHRLKEHYPENSFDQVTCNMAIMEIENFPSILDNIQYVLKSGGQFVFSITHPIFSQPVCRTIKLPPDSQRNEDKSWIVDEYLGERPMNIETTFAPSNLLYFPRKISTYINTLLEYGFLITGLSEPEPSKDQINKFPRDMMYDYVRVPSFMVFRTQLT